MTRGLFILAATLPLVYVCGGCSAPVSTMDSATREASLVALVAHVSREHRSFVPGDTTSISYVVTQGVSAERSSRLFSPLVRAGSLNQMGLPVPTSYCVITGPEDAAAATLCETWQRRDRPPVENVGVFVWDRRRGRWSAMQWNFRGDTDIAEKMSYHEFELHHLSN